MRIRDDIRLGALQGEFRTRFPYLKIEFYSEPHREGMSSAEDSRLVHDQLIGEARTTGATGFFKLDPEQRTTDFEEMFRAVYGLNVQVFRSSKGHWLQTWATDTWSLGEQNRRGELMTGKQKVASGPISRAQRNQLKISINPNNHDYQR